MKTTARVCVLVLTLLILANNSGTRCDLFDMLTLIQERGSFITLAQDAVTAHGVRMSIASNFPHDLERWYDRVAQSWRWLF